jgi:hypothetical protein
MYHPRRTLLEVLREDLALHRHQGRLRRRRLRRLHGGAGRGGRTGRSATARSTAAYGWRISVQRHGSVVDAWRTSSGARCGTPALPAQEAMVDVPRLAMRLLHPGLCDEPVRHVPEPCRARARASTRELAQRRTLGQPLPLHRLPAHPGRGAGTWRHCRRRGRRRDRPAAASCNPSNLKLAPPMRTTWPRARWPACCAARAAPPRSAAGRRLHRRRPVGHQAAHGIRPRARRDPGRRAAAHRAPPAAHLRSARPCRWPTPMPR